MVHILDKENSLISEWIKELRHTEEQNDRMRFRKNIERIGEIMAYEISKKLKFETQKITTPLGIYDAKVLQNQPILATILRAGLPLHQGLLNYFDKADSAFIAAYRKHHKDGSFEIAQEYITSPSFHNRPLIISDPMLATGASLVLAIKSLLELGNPSEIHIVCVIGATQGLDYLAKNVPEANIWIASLDDEITAKGYIVPGLGDAGDLCFGNKEQS